MKFESKVAQNVARALYLYFNFLDRILSWNLRIKGDSSGLSFELENSRTRSEASLDERISKIDLAKENLEDALAAIGELKTEANANKKELEAALEKLRVLETERNFAEQELEELRHVSESDVEAFQKMAGVPTPREKNRDRVLGFIAGILASVIATLLVKGVVFLIYL